MTTLFRWVVRDRTTNECIRTIVSKNSNTATRTLKSNEKLGEQIGRIEVSKEGEE